MSRPNNYVVKNSRNQRCSGCGQVHEYLTRKTDEAGCDTPVAFSQEKANDVAQALAGGSGDVVEVPHDTLVVLDASARKLPQKSGEVEGRLMQTPIGERMV